MNELFEVIEKKIKEAGDMVGIRLLDHIIIGDNKFSSLRELKVI